MPCACLLYDKLYNKLYEKQTFDKKNKSAFHEEKPV